MGPEGDWLDPWVILPLVYSAFCLIAFVTWEAYTQTPLISRSVLQCYSLILTFITTLGISMAFFASLFWVTFFMQDMQQLNPLQVGIRLLPQAVTGLLLSPVIGWWMHKIDNMFFLVAAALLQAGSGALLLLLRSDSNYFAFIFPSLILSTLGMDWVRNVGAQYVSQTLPYQEQLVGAALLQLVTRLGIPIGISITTAIWSSRFPAPEKATTNFDSYPVNTLQTPYLHVFIATLCFTAVAALVAPFAPLGKLGLASTATDSSLSREDTGLKNINLDGPGGWKEDSLSRAPENGCSVSCEPMFNIQPRRSSLLGTSLNNSDWRRTSAGATPFQLPPIGGLRASGDISGLGLGCGLADEDDNDNDADSQQTGTVAMAGRVIWLVCEDCGASKRMVESIGDPAAYFYDGDEVEDSLSSNTVAASGVLASPAPSSKYSSVYEDDRHASVAEVDVAVDGRRFQLVNGRGVMDTVVETSEE